MRKVGYVSYVGIYVSDYICTKHEKVRIGMKVPGCPFSAPQSYICRLGGGTTALAMVRGVEMDIGRGFEARWPVCFVGSQGVIYGIQYVIYTDRSVPALPGNG